jgi:hypothetical protein
MNVRRTSFGRRCWPALLIAAGVAGCGATPNILPSNDFARPTDITFMCFGAFGPSTGDDGGATNDGGSAADAGSNGPVQITGRPMRICHPAGPGNDPGLAQGSRTFAFVVNSANGQLTVVDADRWRLVDLDPESAGYDSALIGSLPQQISATTDGCRLVSANRGSADLTLVDPSVLVAPTFESDFPHVTFPPTPPPDSAIQRGIVPRGADGTPVGAPPFEAVFLPKDTSGMDNQGNLACPPMDGSSSESWPALVSFPACDLIALVDLPSGVVLDSLFVHGSTDTPTFVPGGASPHCPAAAAGGADGGATGVAVDTGTARPWSVQIAPDGNSAFVSLSNAPAVVALTLFGTSIASSVAIPLHENAGGSDRIRLAVDPYQDTTGVFPGVFVGDASNRKDPVPSLHRRYLYVIAHDGTLRVINVESPATLQECETNYDPLTNLFQPQDPDNDYTNCIPVNPAYRRPGVLTGPGIHLPTGIPVDVAAADIRGTATNPSSTIMSNSVQNVSGAFAWVMSSSGLVYLVNIDPERRLITIVDPSGASGSEPIPYANSLRDANRVNYVAGSVASYGPPRLDTPPNVPTGAPFIETFYATSSIDNWTVVDSTVSLPTQVYFPTYAYVEPPPRVTPGMAPPPPWPTLANDFNAVTPQTWTVTWQGTLVAPRFSGHIDNEALTLQDGVGFCDANVLPGDLVTLTGCLVDGDCGSGTVCVRSNTAPEQAAGGIPVRGLCMDPNHASERAMTCGPLLETARRYEITQASPSLLTLRPHRDELVRSPLMQCRNPVKPADAVAPGGDVDGGAADVSEDCRDPNDSTTSNFTCIADPLSGGAARCLQTCGGKDQPACRQGHICVDYTDPSDPSKTQGFCADGPPLNTSSFDRCFDQLVTYQVNAGNAYLITGSSAGILPQVVNRQPTDPNQTQPVCGLDTNPARNPRQVSRIPVGTSSVAGAPDPTGMLCADLPTVWNAAGDPTMTTFTTLPAPLTTAHPNADDDRLQVLQKTPSPYNPCFFVGGPSSNSPTGNHVRAIFQNTQLRFVMGDLERAPSTAVPIRFDVHGGFSPQTVVQPTTVEISMPARIVLTPVDSQPQNTTPLTDIEAPYLMVVDQRRLGRGQGGGPTRGQLLRINPFGYAATYGYQPWFEDFQHSNSLFPIQ